MPEYSDYIYRLIRETLTELSGTPAQSLHETILIRDGFFCGRRFQWESHTAVWFAEEQQIKFYGPDGALCERIDVSPPQDQRRAA